MKVAMCEALCELFLNHHAVAFGFYLECAIGGQSHVALCGAIGNCAAVEPLAVVAGIYSAHSGCGINIAQVHDYEHSVALIIAINGNNDIKRMNFFMFFTINIRCL